MAEDGAERDRGYILAVDGNVDDRFQLGMIIQRFGYDICAANSAAEAVDFMHVAPPAAIVADAVAGVAIAGRTKRDARFSTIPLILLSKMPDLDLDLRVRRGEFAACLTKPLDVEKFYAVLQSAVEKTPRKNIRIETGFAARIENVPDAAPGIVTVLSEYGMFYRTQEPQELNQRLTISFTMEDRLIRVEAVVLYSYSFEASPFRMPGMGLKFVKIAPENQAYIKSYILESVQKGTTRPETAQ